MVVAHDSEIFCFLYPEYSHIKTLQISILPGKIFVLAVVIAQMSARCNLRMIFYPNLPLLLPILKFLIPSIRQELTHPVAFTACKRIA